MPGQQLPFYPSFEHGQRPVLARLRAAATPSVPIRAGERYSSPISEMRKVSSRQPVQGQSNIARPNPPQRTIFKFNDVALVVFLNEHRMPRALGSFKTGPEWA